MVLFLIRLNTLGKQRDANIQLEIQTEDIREIPKELSDPTIMHGEKVIANDAQGENISKETGRNNPVNVSDKFKDDISTEKYEQQVKQEIKYDEWNPDAALDENAKKLKEEQHRLDEMHINKPSVSKSNGQGKTNIYYNLAGRSHSYLPVPIYKCEGGGKVTVSIVVNQQGRVIEATVLSTSANVEDDCFTEAARNSAYSSLFNSKSNSQPNQKGTITYEFIPQ
jgi:outer membrane biosynthesis protein TonB